MQFGVYIPSEAVMNILNYCHGGYDGDIVSVEADLRMGIPGIDIVGMAAGLQSMPATR